MSVYNSDKYLSKSIESILNQSYSNIEFIIINDGSKDNSLDIIKHYKSMDNRITLIDQENKGLTKSLNTAIKLAKGNYIARQDADDISMPNRFFNFIEYANHFKPKIYSTPAYIIDCNDNIQGIIPNCFRRNGFDQKMLNYYNSMIHGTLIIESIVLKKYMYDEDFKLSQDFELYHRLMNNGYNISYNNFLSYKLRLHDEAISSTKEFQQLEYYKQVYVKHGKKYYKKTILNRFYFKLMDFFYYFKIKLKQ